MTNKIIIQKPEYIDGYTKITLEGSSKWINYLMKKMEEDDIDYKII